jgi:hypothetical protein
MLGEASIHTIRPKKNAEKNGKKTYIHTWAYIIYTKDKTNNAKTLSKILPVWHLCRSGDEKTPIGQA